MSRTVMFVVISVVVIYGGGGFVISLDSCRKGNYKTAGVLEKTSVTRWKL